MALTQMQIIQSLGEAMNWFERELSWGVAPGELRHLCGRIGELYAALITNGQMALSANQRGYDVVSKDGERISVKTTTIIGGSGHVSFRKSTLDQVDRVMILRINVEEMQVEVLLDDVVGMLDRIVPIDKRGEILNISLGSLSKKSKPRHEIETQREVHFKSMRGEYTEIIRELENGTIEIERGGALILPVRPELVRIASELNIGTANSNGNELNTRQLGTNIIKYIQNLGEIPDD